MSRCGEHRADHAPARLDIPGLLPVPQRNDELPQSKRSRRDPERLGAQRRVIVQSHDARWLELHFRQCCSYRKDGGKLHLPAGCCVCRARPVAGRADLLARAGSRLSGGLSLFLVNRSSPGGAVLAQLFFRQRGGCRRHGRRFTTTATCFDHQHSLSLHLVPAASAKNPNSEPLHSSTCRSGAWWIFFIGRSGSTGFFRTVSAPSSDAGGSAESTTTGMSAIEGSLFCRRRNSHPSINGIQRSSRTSRCLRICHALSLLP